MAASDATIVGVIVVSKYIVGIDMNDCHIVILMSKNRNIRNSCVQNMLNRSKEKKLNVKSCWVLTEDRICNIFFIFWILILSMLMFCAIVGIEKISVVMATHIALASRMY